MFASLPCGPTKHTSFFAPLLVWSKSSPWHLQLEHHLGTPGYNHASHAVTNSSGREVDRDEQPQLLELEAGGQTYGATGSSISRGHRTIISSDRQSIHLRSPQGEGGAGGHGERGSSCL
ncbi:unnamed protein product [Ectocarpus sp. 12 AP-2014]